MNKHHLPPDAGVRVSLLATLVVIVISEAAETAFTLTPPVPAEYTMYSPHRVGLESVIYKMPR